ncbi:MAG: four helix bundle protein [Polyangiales bacterium]
MSQPPQPFRALHVAYHLIGVPRPRDSGDFKHDASLADQLRRAAQSVALNLAESTGNSRGNRRLRIETAFGSAQETKAALHVARNWRYVDDATVTRAFDLADTVAKLCWRLTR